MADRPSYPSIPAKNWWDLRQRFRSSPPRDVTAAYLSAVLGLQEKAAANLLPSLRTTGLIDENGKPTERAGLWRDDEHYPEVTRAIIAEVYPQALLDAAPPDDPDPTVVKRWFMRDTGTGEGRANILAAFYRLLASGDPAGRDEAPRRSVEKQAAPARQQRQATPRKSKSNAAEPKNGSAGGEIKSPLPSLSVAVQVYFDKDMTAEQVDHVFASMARHLYGKQ